MDQPHLITQVATRNDLSTANKVFLVARHAHPQNPALHKDRPYPPGPVNKGVLHFGALAKYAVAYPGMSRSMLTRADSARKRLISICPALTFEGLSAPFSVSSR
jgi:hypothetical protein